MEPPRVVGHIDGNLRNNFHVLTEAKIGRLDREKAKERPFDIQGVNAHRTGLFHLEPI